MLLIKMQKSNTFKYEHFILKAANILMLVNFIFYWHDRRDERGKHDAIQRQCTN
jgi:hypothetical protein